MSDRENQYLQAQLEHQRISRRGIFRGIWRGAKTGLAEIECRPFRRACARPPSCVDEALLTELCDGCGQCEDACSQRVLKLSKGKPELNLDCNYCTHCGDCARACQTGVLAHSSRSTGVIPLIGDNCQRMYMGLCELCGSSCPMQAIEFSGKLPSVNNALCTGCGECRSFCPSGAISYQIIDIV
ncbi:4Fe-4S binding protein [Vibrio sp. WXL103]|uniref:4Fe-4S binding protein n=1 Tax=unclassified Vibrio TaxID=2614977 RepID=UPI003EC6CBA3